MAWSRWIGKSCRCATTRNSRTAKPEVARFKLSQTYLQKSLADVLKGQQKLAEARSLLEQSITTLKQLSEHDHAAPFARMSMSPHYRALADVLSDMGEKEAAAEARSHVMDFRRPRPFGPRMRSNNRSTSDAISAEKADGSNVDQPTSGESGG
jgi:hypothetical protein